MDRTRIKLAVYVDLDPIPGTFHSVESAQNSVRNILNDSIGHYNPMVSLEHVSSSISAGFCFDEENPNWTRDQMANELFLRGIEEYMNQRLVIKGHVFLNEVLDALGFTRIPLGAIHGWTFDGKERKPIEFKRREPDERGRIAIDFVTDGVMYNKI